MATCDGHCLCGAVTLRGKGTPSLHICHCGQCLHWHGGPGMAIFFGNGVDIVSGHDQIGVYESSDWATRSFCKTCGATLFYQLKGKPLDSAQAGLFDLPEGLEVSEHIFVDDKPDWYDFSDNAPRLTGAEVFAKYAGSNDA